MKLFTVIKEIADYQHKPISTLEKTALLSNGTISKWNKIMPRADNLQKVADALGTTTQHLFYLAKSKSSRDPEVEKHAK